MKIKVTDYTIVEVEKLYEFDIRNSENIASSESNTEVYRFGPYTRTYWFNGTGITHTELEYDNSETVE